MRWSRYVRGGVETLGMQGRRRDEWEGVGIGKEEGEGRRGEIREGGERRGTMWGQRRRRKEGGK